MVRLNISIWHLYDEHSPLVSIITRYRQTKEDEARSTSVASDFAAEQDQHSEDSEEEEEVEEEVVVEEEVEKGGCDDGKEEVDKGDSKEGGADQNGEVKKNEGGQSETEV